MPHGDPNLAQSPVKRKFSKNYVGHNGTPPTQYPVRGDGSSRDRGRGGYGAGSGENLSKSYDHQNRGGVGGAGGPGGGYGYGVGSGRGGTGGARGVSQGTPGYGKKHDMGSNRHIAEPARKLKFRGVGMSSMKR